MSRPNYAGLVFRRISEHRGRPRVGECAPLSVPTPLQASDPNVDTEVPDPIAAAVERLFALSDQRTFISDPS